MFRCYRFVNYRAQTKFSNFNTIAIRVTIQNAYIKTKVWYCFEIPHLATDQSLCITVLSCNTNLIGQCEALRTRFLL